MSVRHRSWVFFQFATAIAAGLPCAALAQAQQAQTTSGQASTAQEPESASIGELAEVVVTAEKRESSLQKTAVAVYFDGAYLSESVLQGMMFDLQRVEVDKGPQTTLFGKDAEAGAINFISNKPVLGETSGEGELEYGSYNTVRTEGVINVPIGDTFALRAAGQTFSHRGYMDSGLDDADTQSARLSALWRPNDQESLLDDPAGVPPLRPQLELPERSRAGPRDHGAEWWHLPRRCALVRSAKQPVRKPRNSSDVDGQGAIAVGRWLVPVP
jgi:outer membrane receptor protein involved in Fe transport